MGLVGIFVREDFRHKRKAPAPTSISFTTSFVPAVQISVALFLVGNLDGIKAHGEVRRLDRLIPIDIAHLLHASWRATRVQLGLCVNRFLGPLSPLSRSLILLFYWGCHHDTGDQAALLID